MLKKVFALLTALAVMLFSLAAAAETVPVPSPEVTPLPDDIEMEGMAVEEKDTADATALIDGLPIASIEGKKPLYHALVKPFIATGKQIFMRLQPSKESPAVCAVPAWSEVTVYEVLPAFVLADFEGNIGYIIRTWIADGMLPVDEAGTIPYGVVPAQFVATLTETAAVHVSPDKNSEVFSIHPGKGGKIAILEFVDGFAKVLIHRDYGYIDAALLTDLVVVANGPEPLSADTPMAAFASFFDYNTRKKGNEGRCVNIALAAAYMSMVMQPGDVLDFNGHVGPYKRSKGYQPAPVLINGGSQLGSGGGTCQASSTLYNAVRQLPGLTILHARRHGPGCARYLPMHQDAAVGSEELNFIFRNDYDFPIEIVADSLGTGVLCIQIYKLDKSVTDHPLANPAGKTLDFAPVVQMSIDAQDAEKPPVEPTEKP